MLKMLDKYKIKASFFVPGHTLDSFPEECALIRAAGHEFGLHGMYCSLQSETKPGLNHVLSGYSHENPIAMTLQQQRDVLDYTFKQLTDFCGKPPIGFALLTAARFFRLLFADDLLYRCTAPWWENSKVRF